MGLGPKLFFVLRYVVVQACPNGYRAIGVVADLHKKNC